jgi:NAD-dependent dihydropyrimidine dehydrogenase PreA subunit
VLDKRMVWLDQQRCLGCSQCVEACPVGAIGITNEKAHIDDGLCTGCGACVAACPEGAIQFVVEGEVIAVEERAVVPAVRQPSAVVEVAEPAVVVGSTILLVQTARTIVSQLGHWLSQAARHVGSSLGQVADNYVEPSSQPARGAGGAGHRERHRRGRR